MKLYNTGTKSSDRTRPRGSRANPGMRRNRGASVVSRDSSAAPRTMAVRAPRRGLGYLFCCGRPTHGLDEDVSPPLLRSSVHTRWREQPYSSSSSEFFVMDSFWQGHLQASSDEGAESSCQGSQPLNTFEWSALPPLVRFSAPLIRAHEAGSEFDDSPVASVWVHDIFVSKEPIFDQMRRDWAEYDKWHAARRAALMAAKCQATVAEVGAATVSSAASGSSSVSIPSGASRSGFGASASGGGGGGSSSSGISPWRFRPLALSSVRWTPPSLPSKSSLASLVNGGSEGGGGGAGGRGGSTSGGSVAVSAHEGGGSREVAGELACLRSNWFSLPQHASAHHGALLFPTGELACLRSNWSSLPQHASAHHGAPLFPAASNSNTPAQDGAVGVATRGAAAAAACAGSQSAPENSASNNYTEGDSLLQRFSDLFSFHSDPPRTTEDMGGALVASQQASQQAAQ